jgi:AraC family transcriptional regulator
VDVVEIRKLGNLKIAYVEHIGSYMDCGPAWAKLMQWAIKNNALNKKTMMLGLCYNDPKKVPVEELHYDACLSIPEGLSAEGDIKIKVLTSTEYAVTTLKGAYKNLGPLWTEMFEKWLPKSGLQYKEGSPCLERYLNTPGNTPEDDLITELHLPVYELL